MGKWMFLIVIVVSCFLFQSNAWENPNLKYFGFYTYNNSDYELMPYANLYESDSLEVLVKARTRGLLGLYFVQGIFFPGYVVNKNYVEAWQNSSKLVAPLVANGTVLGFMMGDELIYSGVPWQALDDAVTLVKKTFPNCIIYTNEAYPTFTGNTYYYPQVPFNLDWISIDFYPVEGTFETLRSIYFNLIYPKMFDHQKVMYVSGVYSTVVSPSYYCGNVQCEQVMISWNLQAFQWAQTDPRFVGLFPWHFDTFNSTFLPGFEIGLRNLPQLTQAISHIATQITTGKSLPSTPGLAGSICGLTASSQSTAACAGLSPAQGCPKGYANQTWLISTDGQTMSFCASSSNTFLPTGGICGMNTGGDTVPCGGFDPEVGCPDGYFQQLWRVKWGSGNMYFCEKTNGTIPDATGTLCGMMTGPTGVTCGGVNPNTSCPPSYASASWSVPFGNMIWSTCFLI